MAGKVFLRVTAAWHILNALTTLAFGALAAMASARDLPSNALDEEVASRRVNDRIIYVQQHLVGEGFRTTSSAHRVENSLAPRRQDIHLAERGGVRLRTFVERPKRLRVAAKKLDRGKHVDESTDYHGGDG